MRRAAVWLLALLLILTGCGSKAQQQGGAAKASEIQYQGGSYNREVILSSLDVQPLADGYEISIVFTRADSLPLGEMPRFQLTEIKNPYRLVLSGNFVSDNLSQQVLEYEDLICFKSKRSGLVEIAFQTPHNAYFSVAEAKDTLRITVSPVSQHAEDAGYLVMSYDDSAQIGLLAESLGMDPAVLHGDVVFLSGEGYETLALAQAQREACSETCAPYGIAVEAMLLGADDFASNARSGSQNAQIEQHMPVDVSAQCWVYGAAYLCSYDDNRAIFARKLQQGKWTLCRYSYDGTGSELEGAHADSRITACIPCDAARYLAYCDEAGRAYWYDTISCDSHEILPGLTVLDFVWAQDGRLYLLTSQEHQNEIYAFHPDGGTEKITSAPGAVRLQAGGGMVMFLDDQGVLKMISAQGEVVSGARRAIDFLVDDNRLILIEQNDLCTLVCYTLGGDTAQVLLEAQEIAFADTVCDGEYLHLWVEDGSGSALHTYRFSDGRMTRHEAPEMMPVHTIAAGWICTTVWIQEDLPITYKIHLQYQ